MLLLEFIEITFFHFYQQNKSYESKVKFRQTNNHCTMILEAVKFAYVTKAKLGSWYFWQIPNGVLHKGKSAMPPLFNSLEVLSSASDEAKLFPKKLPRNSNFDDSSVSLPVFPSRTNPKLHSISITAKIVKKVLTNLDSSKASGLDCIPVVVPKKCELEPSSILTNFFSMSLKESFFQIVGRSHT